MMMNDGVIGTHEPPPVPCAFPRSPSLCLFVTLFVCDVSHPFARSLPPSLPHSLTHSLSLSLSLCDSVTPSLSLSVSPSLPLCLSLCLRLSVSLCPCRLLETTCVANVRGVVVACDRLLYDEFLLNRVCAVPFAMRHAAARLHSGCILLFIDASTDQVRPPV